MGNSNYLPEDHDLRGEITIKVIVEEHATCSALKVSQLVDDLTLALNKNGIRTVEGGFTIPAN